MKARTLARAAVPLLILLSLLSCSTGTDAGSYTLSDGSTVETTDVSYSATESDVSAVCVTNGALTLNSPTITKSGDASASGDGKKGNNAAVLASSSSATITIDGGTIESSASGGNGVVAYDGSTVTLTDVAITNTGSGDCRGIYVTYAGVVTATNVTATTSGKNSSVVATDQGGGTITLTGGSFSASGADSAGLYSTGTITGTGLAAASTVGEACVIEGSNSITLTGSTLSSGAGNRGILMLQSGSGDAGSGYNAAFTMTGGSITTTTSASTNSDNTFSTLVPVFEVVSNAVGTITLTDVTVTSASGVLVEVDYNTRWTTNGAAGNLVLATASASYAVTGNVLADSYSTASVTVGTGVTWTGTFDNANAAKSGAVTVQTGGTWVLSGDSYVDTLTKNGTITLNGHTLYVNGTAWSG